MYFPQKSCARVIASSFAIASVFAASTGAHAQSQFPAVKLPNIPAKTFRITDFGAVGDAKTLNTSAIQKAIDACELAGGGTVDVPAGRFLTGPFALKSSINLFLEKDATIFLSSNVQDYITPGSRNRNCIVADNCHDVSITGRGTIDGQGSYWWDRYRKNAVPKAGDPPLIHRPYMVVFSKCTRVFIQNVTLTNSPSFHLVPAQCQDVTIEGIHIIAPADAPNTDGMDPSGWNYHIFNCTFDVGDDDIALKPSGRIEEGQPSCKNFLIEKCAFLHGHGMSIGGQSPGGLDGMIVRNCTFTDTQAGIRMKAPRGQGGLVQNIVYENLQMKNVKLPIYITSYYPKTPANPAEDVAQPVNSKTPIWQHIQIKNVTSTGSPSAGIIYGLPEMPVSDIVLTNVTISAARGFEIANANGIKFVNSSIHVDKGLAVKAQKADVTGIDLPTGH